MIPVMFYIPLKSRVLGPGLYWIISWLVRICMGLIGYYFTKVKYTLC